jgi:hypothetical protein
VKVKEMRMRGCALECVRERGRGMRGKRRKKKSRSLLKSRNLLTMVLFSTIVDMNS